MGQGALQVRGRLGVRAGLRGGPGGAQAEVDGARVVARRGGVVHEARGVDVPAAERLQHLAVQRRPPAARQRLLDDAARELVAEPHHAALHLEQPALLALGERRGRVVLRLAHQPQLGRARDDGDEVQHRARRRGEPAPPARARHPARSAAAASCPAASASVTKNALPPVTA